MDCDTYFYGSTQGEVRNPYKILVGKIKGINHLGHLGADWRVILKLIIEKPGVSMWSGFN
jgi:hypothetical protein